MPFEPFTPKMACAVGRSINDRISATLGRSGYLSYTALAAREFGLKVPTETVTRKAAAK